MWNGNNNAELLIDAHVSVFKQIMFKRKNCLQFVGFEKIMQGSTHFALPGFFNDLYILLRKNVRYQLGITAISSKSSQDLQCAIGTSQQWILYKELWGRLLEKGRKSWKPHHINGNIHVH